MPGASADLDRSQLSPDAAHAAMLEALLAGEGLTGVAEIATELVGAPVEVLIPRPGSDGADGSAAERYVAALVAGEEPELPGEVGAAVPIVSAGDAQGAVVMLGEGGDAAEAYLRATALASLTGVAMLNAREDASRGSGGRLIAELREGAAIRPSEIVRRAKARGCDLTDGVVALGVGGAERPEQLVATVAAERPDALVEAHGNRVWALLPGAPQEAQRISVCLLGRARSALSSRYRQAADARLALEEAEILLALVEASGYDNADRPTWDSLRILFRTFVADPEELVSFSERTVGGLVRHDGEHGSELEATFWAYQESNCNMNLTAKATYTHRHTVSNRLTRIEELTGLDPSRGFDRDLLSLALKANLVIATARRR
jgi:hypothetical protein